MLICEAPLIRGLMAGHPATGTHAGYYRHLRAGEPACEACLAATSARGNAWNKANRGRINKKRRRQYQKLRQDPNYQPRVDPKAPERRRLYYRANRERERAQFAEWRQKNKARMAAHERLRRARKRGVVTIEFTQAQLDARMRYWGERCWMCGGPGEAWDHVKPLTKGGPHMLANLRPACGTCNSGKNNRWPYPAVLQYANDRRRDDAA